MSDILNSEVDFYFLSLAYGGINSDLTLNLTNGTRSLQNFSAENCGPRLY